MLTSSGTYLTRDILAGFVFPAWLSSISRFTGMVETLHRLCTQPLAARFLSYLLSFGFSHFSLSSLDTLLPTGQSAKEVRKKKSKRSEQGREGVVTTSTIRVGFPVVFLFPKIVAGAAAVTITAVASMVETKHILGSRL